jgi:hypothetical protein
MKLLYIDCNDITKHVVLQDVMEHAVNDLKKKKKPYISTEGHRILFLQDICQQKPNQVCSSQSQVSTLPTYTNRLHKYNMTDFAPSVACNPYYKCYHLQK